MQFQSGTKDRKGTDHYIRLVLFIMLYEGVLSFESVEYPSVGPFK